MRSLRFSAIALCFLVLGSCTSAVRKPPPGTADLVPFNTFLQGVRTARYEDYAGRPGVKVRDQAAFEEMRAHVLKMYDGVQPVHTFVSDGALFDCIAIASQPAVRLLGLTRIERQPPASAAAGGYAAGRTPGDAKAIESPLRLGLKDPYGNRMSCVTETIPMARITLDTMTRFTTLDDFFSKGPGGGGLPSGRQGEIDPGGRDHLYAVARQDDLTNFGGNSWLNLWTPTGGFTLSQQWYAGGGSGAGQQTVEGGWVVYKEKFKWRPDRADTTHLSLGTIHDSDGFGVGHLPLLEGEFGLWEPVIIRREEVSVEELDGYDIWKESRGGVWQ